MFRHINLTGGLCLIWWGKQQQQILQNFSVNQIFLSTAVCYVKYNNYAQLY